MGLLICGKMAAKTPCPRGRRGGWFRGRNSWVGTGFLPLWSRRANSLQKDLGALLPSKAAMCSRGICGDNLVDFSGLTPSKCQGHHGFNPYPPPPTFPRVLLLSGRRLGSSGDEMVKAWLPGDSQPTPELEQVSTQKPNMSQ